MVYKISHFASALLNGSYDIGVNMGRLAESPDTDQRLARPARKLDGHDEFASAGQCSSQKPLLIWHICFHDYILDI